MKLLIDTQAFIWYVENDKKLKPKIKETLEDSSNELLLSIASLWEVAIKLSLGKLQLSGDMATMVDRVYKNGFEILPIKPEHIISLSTLSFFHRDPFDRIIISQALTEEMRIVSSDKIFDKYKVKRLWK